MGDIKILYAHKSGLRPHDMGLTSASPNDMLA